MRFFLVSMLLWHLIPCSPQVSSLQSIKFTNRIVALLGEFHSIKARSDAEVNIWVYFKDKGTLSDNNRTYLESLSLIHPKALWRRKTRGDAVIGDSDLPVFSDYVSGVLSTGVTLRKSSRWLNSISVSILAESTSILSERLHVLASLQYVTSIDVVSAFTRVPVPVHATALVLGRKQRNTLSDIGIDYGESYNQLQLINAISAHSLGYNGTGVIVMIADTGFQKTHPALPMERVLGEYDFVQNDADTSSSAGESHGTATFSNLGGWAPGELIGTGFGSQFLLAKTEDSTKEEAIEEDNLISALEWGEGLGADIVSASLGYSQWYTYADMDGATSPLSRACDKAVSNGMVVVVSNGNAGNGGISAPADAKNVISVGAVDYAGSIASFSSLGPSADGRIKPEVCAQGVLNRVADASYPKNQYTRMSGTSFSCPLIAGAAAILLQAHPDWTPAMVKEALMNTASQRNAPSINYGWGIIDTIAALNYSPNVGCTNFMCPLGCHDDQCVCPSEYYGRDCNFSRVVCGSECTSRRGLCLGDPVPQSSASFLCVDKCGCTGNTQCVISSGKYYCICPSGYNLTSDFFCEDINECTAHTDDCKSPAQCKNDAGAYHCECPYGYAWNAENLTCNVRAIDTTPLQDYRILIGVACFFVGLIIAAAVLFAIKHRKYNSNHDNTPDYALLPPTREANMQI